MDPKIDLAVVARFAHVGIQVLQARALTWATMLMTCAAFGYTVFDPNPLRIAASTIFGLLVFWRVTWLEKANQQKGESNG